MKREVPTDPRSTVLAFVETINEHDAEGLANLMSMDHSFVDSQGRGVKGREKKGYFSYFPDYHISVSEVFEKNGSFVLLGSAQWNV